MSPSNQPKPTSELCTDDQSQ